MNPMRTTLFVKMARVSPPLGELFMSLLGVASWLKHVAEIREQKGYRAETRPPETSRPTPVRSG